MLRHGCFALLLFISPICRAVDWNPEDEIPPVTHLGAVSDQARAHADHMRQDLVKVLAYWKSVGLVDPPDLEALINIGDVDHVRIVELLEQLNPTIPEIAAHVATQYSALKESEFARNLRFIVPVLNMFWTARPFEKWLDFIFDHYAFVRYGYAISDMARAVAENRTLRESGVDSQGPTQDNAFYGRFPRVDLVDLLPKAINYDPNQKPDGGFIRFELLDKAFTKNGSGLSRRLVFLPRSTQTADDWDLITIRDLSVTRHELGHHISATTRGDLMHVHLIIEEVIADYVASVAGDDPAVGGFFARASGLIADRLAKEEPRDLSSLHKEYAFRRLAEKGFMRDPRVPVNIDQLNRRFLIANAYEAGNPLRHFLWNLRNGPEVDSARFDRLVLLALKEHSLLPLELTPRADFALKSRSVYLYFLRKFLHFTKTFGAKQPDKETNAKLHRRAVDEVFDSITDVHEFQEWSKTRSADAKKRLDRIIRMRTYEAHQILIKEWQDHPKVSERIFAAEKDWFEKKTSREAKDMEARLKAAEDGNPSRRRLSADYVIPEFLRTFYRVATKEYPEILDAITEEAARAMNLQAQVFRLDDGTSELAFLPQENVPLFSPTILRRHLNRLAVLRLELADRPHGQQSLDPEIKAKFAKPLAEYSELLDRVREFERTGKRRRLYLPFVRQRIGQATAKYGFTSSFWAFQKWATWYQKRHAKKCEKAAAG